MQMSTGRRQGEPGCLRLRREPQQARLRSSLIPCARKVAKTGRGWRLLAHHVLLAAVDQRALADPRERHDDRHGLDTAADEGGTVCLPGSPGSHVAT